MTATPLSLRPHRRRGQSLVEFMLVVGILIFIVFAGICVMQYILAQYAVNQAARAAATRTALIGEYDLGTATTNVGTYSGGSPIVNDVRTSLNGSIGVRSEATTLQGNCEQSPCRRFDRITVTVSYSDTFWAPIGPFVDTFTVRATAVSTAERDGGS